MYFQTRIAITLTAMAASLCGQSRPSLTDRVTAMERKPTPHQIGMLRWYEVINGMSFRVGTNPVAAAFDGANIWVANRSTGDVTKLRANDGSTVGSYTIGAEPYSVAFDGANVWVAAAGNNNVVKLRASDGSRIGAYSVGTRPINVAFDGANVWVANN